jgi:hypothetical protein
MCSEGRLRLRKYCCISSSSIWMLSGCQSPSTTLKSSRLFFLLVSLRCCYQARTRQHQIQNLYLDSANRTAVPLILRLARLRLPATNLEGSGAKQCYCFQRRCEGAGELACRIHLVFLLQILFVHSFSWVSSSYNIARNMESHKWTVAMPIAILKFLNQRRLYPDEPTRKEGSPHPPHPI